jgi:hypothetical protein
MNFISNIFKLPEIKCHNCCIIVPSKDDLSGCDLCRTCHNRFVEETIKSRKENFKKILKLIETDRDVLLAWLLQGYCRLEYNHWDSRVSLASMYVEIIEECKNNKLN